MHRNQSRLPIRASILGSFMAPLLAAGLYCGATEQAHAAAYQITDLVTDDPAASRAWVYHLQALQIRIW